MNRLIEKYLHLTGVRTGRTAFRIWLYAVTAAALKEKFDAVKCHTILQDAKNFAAGNWMRFNGTDEERDDLAAVISELESLA